jgi:hypothetical protein
MLASAVGTVLDTQLTRYHIAFAPFSLAHTKRAVFEA